MADVSLSDLGSSSNPLAGLDASDYQGFGSGGNQTDPFSGSQLAGASVLGAGALGFGALLARGPSPLPPQYGQLQGMVPDLTSKAQSLEAGGAALTAQGTDALRMAQAGQLTPEQQANLNQFRTGETNKARQMFASMGRNPDADTAFLSESGNIDTRVNAMAQQQIQSTIALGFGEIQGGASLTGQGLQFQTQADQILYQAAQAQVQQDTSFSNSLTSAFTAIGTMFAKAAPMLAA